MKTGTDSIGAIWGSPLKKCAAKMTKLPVMWAVNSPLRPRKLMMSVHPAGDAQHNEQRLYFARLDRGG
jgi:hypothetical protein